MRGYIQDTKVYLCPADSVYIGPAASFVEIGKKRVASYLMAGAWDTDPGYIWTKGRSVSYIKNPGEAWVFVHAEEADDGSFGVPDDGSDAEMPTSAHFNGMVPVALFDGHVEAFKNICGYNGTNPGGVPTCTKDVPPPSCPAAFGVLQHQLTCNKKTSPTPAVYAGYPQLPWWGN